jgi:ketosteroid isomerase-like protein
MRVWRVVLLVFIVFTTSCGEVHSASRQLVKLSSLQTAAAKFDHIASGLTQTWNSRDTQVVKELFTEDAKANDKTFGDNAVGPDQITGLIAIVSSFGPNWEANLTDQYIGLDNGLAVDELWNLKLGNIQFTQDHPMIEVDWLQTRDDLISNWTIFYSLETMEELGVSTSQRLDQARSLLSSYQSAWSSGDEQAVTQLYANNAVREDTIFLEQQEGQKEIISFAKSFFNWYPDAQWNLSLVFGEGIGDTPTTGGLYVIKLIALNGQFCEVKVAVLLQTSKNLITHEYLYYNPQSLIKCGWAQ